MTVKYTINPDFDHIADALRRVLPFQFDTAGRLIYDRRNHVKDIEIDGQHFIVKRFKHSPIHQRIDYTLRRPSKARRAYTFALRLQHLGISTPTAVACIETYKYGIFSDGYVVTTPCYDPDLRILRTEPDSHPDLMRALMTFIIDMHQKGFMHGDTNLSNFLYRADPSSKTGFHITTIDINRSRFVDYDTERACLANLMRLTHIRPLLQTLVEEYAKQRGWNRSMCVGKVMKRLDMFERRKQILNRLKHPFNSHPDK